MRKYHVIHKMIIREVGKLFTFMTKVDKSFLFLYQQKYSRILFSFPVSYIASISP